MNKANILILFCFILNMVLPYPAAAGPVRAPRTNNISAAPRETPQQDPQQIITDFYNGKAEAALKNIKTYRDRYNAISFYSYPRTFWNDVMPLPPFDRKGALFTLSLQDTYNDIKTQKSPPNAQAMAAWAVNQIILNPRRAEVAKQTEMPQPGDIWHNAFYMASFYTQLSDFAEKIRSEEADYKEYKKHLAIKDPKTRDFMLAGYKDRDFSIAQAKYDRGIFFERMKDIQDFITGYAAGADIFIRRVLTPLQANEIYGADVKKYLEERVLESELPEGINKQAFIKVIMEEIPNPQEIQKRAGEINPSFQEQREAFGRLFTTKIKDIEFEDLGKAASLFEYILPSTLIERVSHYGKIPNREEVLKDLSAALAAGALNKSLAQIADGLMEFEKPFYYSYNSFGSKEEAVGKSWHAIATNDSYKDQIIAKIATDNILQSGRTGYQTSGLSRSIAARRIKENTEFYAKAIPLAVDFTSAGNMAFILAERIFRGGKYIANIRKTDELKAAVKDFEVTAKKLTKPNVAKKDFLWAERFELSPEHSELVPAIEMKSRLDKMVPNSKKFSGAKKAEFDRLSKEIEDFYVSTMTTEELSARVITFEKKFQILNANHPVLIFIGNNIRPIPRNNKNFINFDASFAEGKNILSSVIDYTKNIHKKFSVRIDAHGSPDGTISLYDNRTKLEDVGKVIAANKGNAQVNVSVTSCYGGSCDINRLDNNINWLIEAGEGHVNYDAFYHLSFTDDVPLNLIRLNSNGYYSATIKVNGKIRSGRYYVTKAYNDMFSKGTLKPSDAEFFKREFAIDDLLNNRFDKNKLLELIINERRYNGTSIPAGLFPDLPKEFVKNGEVILPESAQIKAILRSTFNTKGSSELAISYDGWLFLKYDYGYGKFYLINLKDNQRRINIITEGLVREGLFSRYS
jgi:hypothetical protein